jgi:hypothetical protein
MHIGFQMNRMDENMLTGKNEKGKSLSGEKNLKVQ